jgi:hypothetical protein
MTPSAVKAEQRLPSAFQRWRLSGRGSQVVTLVAGRRVRAGLQSMKLLK